VGEQDHAVAEAGRLVFLESQVQGWQLGVEDAGAEGVGSEEAVTTSVPGGGITGIGGVVEDGDGDGVAASVASESAPAAAGSPGGVAFDTLAGEIDAGGTGGIGGINLGGPSAGVEKDAALFRGRFEPVGDSQAEEAILCVLEDNAVDGGEGDGQIDDASMRAAREDIASSLVENLLVIASYPDRLDD